MLLMLGWRGGGLGGGEGGGGEGVRNGCVRSLSRKHMTT